MLLYIHSHIITVVLCDPRIACIVCIFRVGTYIIFDSRVLFRQATNHSRRQKKDVKHVAADDFSQLQRGCHGSKRE